jgi:hypothetical protein
MIEIEITKRFNDDIMYPRDIYEINIYRYDGRREKGTEKGILPKILPRA